MYMQVETMLVQTHDPIADFVNAVCSDVIAFAATITYEKLLKQTSVLSKLSTYSQLMRRSKHIGFEVTKVRIRWNTSSCVFSLHSTMAVMFATLLLYCWMQGRSTTSCGKCLGKFGWFAIRNGCSRCILSLGLPAFWLNTLRLDSCYPSQSSYTVHLTVHVG